MHIHPASVANKNYTSSNCDLFWASLLKICVNYHNIYEAQGAILFCNKLNYISCVDYYLLTTWSFVGCQWSAWLLDKEWLTLIFSSFLQSLDSHFQVFSCVSTKCCKQVYHRESAYDKHAGLYVHFSTLQIYVVFVECMDLTLQISRFSYRFRVVHRIDGAAHEAYVDLSKSL